MKIGIIGTGNIGSNLARLFAKAGHEVIISYSRSEEKLQALTEELGSSVSIGSVEDAVQQTDIAVLSIRLSVLDKVKALMGEVNGRIIIDTNNPFGIKLPEGTSTASEISRRLPGIKLVKAFNTLYFANLLTDSFNKPLLIMPVSSDDGAAKDVVKTLIRDAGFEPFDLGNLNDVILQEPKGIFYSKKLTLEEAEQLYQGR